MKLKQWRKKYPNWLTEVCEWAVGEWRGWNQVNGERDFNRMTIIIERPSIYIALTKTREKKRFKENRISLDSSNPG